MFTSLRQSIARFCTGTSRRRHSRPPSVAQMEQLEPRALMTTYLILDYTPDHRTGSLADTFATVRERNGSVPNFLDFDRDGRATANDVDLAANQITARVQQLFNDVARGYDFRVIGGDVTNSNWGQDWIRRGSRNSKDEVAVMYFGGTNSRGAGIVGNAPVADDGTNVEGYGSTYTRASALLMTGSSFSPTDFVNDVAATATHELGHMLGLRHARSSNEPNNVMNASSSTGNAANVGFRDKTIPTEGGANQNAAREVRASMGRQPQVQQNSDNGGQFRLATLDAYGCHDADGHESHADPHHDALDETSFEDGPQLTGVLDDYLPTIGAVTHRDESAADIVTTASPTGSAMRELLTGSSVNAIDAAFAEFVGASRETVLTWETPSQESTGDQPFDDQHSPTNELDASTSTALDTLLFRCKSSPLIDGVRDEASVV